MQTNLVKIIFPRKYSVWFFVARVGLITVATGEPYSEQLKHIILFVSKIKIIKYLMLVLLLIIVLKVLIWLLVHHRNY